LAARHRHAKVDAMNRVLPLAALVAACGPQPSPPAGNGAAEAVPAKSSAPAPKAYEYDEENDLIEYHFGWSAEAAAVPQLVARFRAEMEKGEAELLASAKDDKAYRDKEGFPFHAYSSTTDYATAGQSQRLLSLTVDGAAYTGGAHGNFGTSGLLWDRQAGKEIKIADLFAAPANMDRLLTQRWCDALNKAREEKRGEPVGGGGMFDDCPKLSEIAIVPTDKDKNGHFERLMLTASPYVAGPYVEGSYEIDLPVTPDLIAALKADYRGSFEPGQPQ
jgi:Deacetylase PdaC